MDILLRENLKFKHLIIRIEKVLMKRHYDNLKVSSLILLYILISPLTGCHSTRELTKTDFPKYSRNLYFIHSPQSFYKLSYGYVSDGLLIGVIAPGNKKPLKRIQIFVNSDSSILKNGNVVNIPLSKIEKSEVHWFDFVKTGGLVAVS
jgi:hypothetical protein